jgi:hypothetical protein
VAGEIGTGANSTDQLRVRLMVSLTDSLLAVGAGLSLRVPRPEREQAQFGSLDLRDTTKERGNPRKVL